VPRNATIVAPALAAAKPWVLSRSKKKASGSPARASRSRTKFWSVT
jgi:hypothetical protein